MKSRSVDNQDTYAERRFSDLHIGDSESLYRIADEIFANRLDYYVDALITYVNPPKISKIVEVGSGFGHFTIKLAMLGYKNVSGIDLSYRRVNLANEVAKRFGVPCRFEPMELNSLPAGWDLIVSKMFIHHFPDLTVPLKHIYWALTPGGTFFAYEPNPFNVLEWNTYELDTHTWKIKPKRGSPNEWAPSPVALRRNLKECNFRDVRVLGNFIVRPVQQVMSRIPLLKLFGFHTIAIARK